ncbi:Bbp19 family protein [Croceicoccus mobilis]|nr:hypothetical protein [Croceicoccus mobilis]
MSVTPGNRLRWRAICVSRMVKDVFWAVVPRRWLWRWLFLDEEGRVHRPGEAVLADLRDYAGLGRSNFNSDPLMMARLAGRQDVALRIINYLNLDEAQVQQLMEIDDGL